MSSFFLQTALLSFQWKPPRRWRESLADVFSFHELDANGSSGSPKNEITQLPSPPPPISVSVGWVERTGSFPHSALPKWGCASVYLVILLSSFSSYSVVISLPMHVSLILVMAEWPIRPVVTTLEYPPATAGQPKASRKSRGWEGENGGSHKSLMRVRLPQTLRTHLGLDFLQHYKWRLLCCLMDGLQQNSGELQHCFGHDKDCLKYSQAYILQTNVTFSGFSVTTTADMARSVILIKQYGVDYVMCCIMRVLWCF